MTTGHELNDHRTRLAGTQGLYGLRYERTWDGADMPKLPKVPRPTPMYDTNVFVQMRVNRFGKRKLYLKKVRIRRYLPTSPPPKRVRLKTDHAYTTYVNSEFSDFVDLSDGRSFTNEGAGAGALAVPDPFGPNLDLALISKLREKIAGSSFNAGIVLGEGKEALSMIGDSAIRIAKALYMLKRGRLRDAAHVLTSGTDRWVKKPTFSKGKTISDNWLQLQYGWLPLVSDVYDGAQFLAHHLNVPMTTRMRVSKVHHFGKVHSQSVAVEPIKTKFLQRKTILVDLIEKDVAKLAGLQDPLSVAWELVPYSFVVDWFIPIGQFLSARGLASAIDANYIVITKSDGEVIGMKNAPGYDVISPCGGYRHRVVAFNRTAPSKLLSFPLPELKPLSAVASWKHCANAVALLVRPVSKQVDSLRMDTSKYTS